ncbi:MAG: menaquinone biosynthesis protein [Armatimonadetes bacterium]|nr:menaquinone biosynthesis protein [Armatimonadota bacterium]
MKIGAVPYLNGRPLVHGLEREPRVELITDVPSRLAQKLQDKEIAAGLLSVFACFENPGLQMVPGICIGCDGPADSVRIFLGKPVDQLRTVALDTSSLSSVNLARIILRERYGIVPDFVDMRPDVEEMLDLCDAAVTIGDITMTSPQDRWPMLDLGEEWKLLTGLPFVFAVWAVNPDMASPELVDILTEARQRGMASLDEISESESKRLDLPSEVCYRYLSEIMDYDMTERHYQALELFRQKSCAMVPGLRMGPVSVFCDSQNGIYLR